MSPSADMADPLDFLEFGAGLMEPVGKSCISDGGSDQVLEGELRMVMDAEALYVVLQGGSGQRLVCVEAFLEPSVVALWTAVALAPRTR